MLLLALPLSNTSSLVLYDAANEKKVDSVVIFFFRGVIHRANLWQRRHGYHSFRMHVNGELNKEKQVV
jgi:hypothetical protein